jgi:hypothetical protein
MKRLIVLTFSGALAIAAPLYAQTGGPAGSMGGGASGSIGSTGSSSTIDSSGSSGSLGTTGPSRDPATGSMRGGTADTTRGMPDRTPSAGTMSGSGSTSGGDTMSGSGTSSGMDSSGGAIRGSNGFENVELYRRVPLVLRPYSGRRVDFDQIDTFGWGSDQDIGSNADVVSRGRSLVDRGHSRGECLACHGDGVVVIEICVVDQYATREPLPSEYADRDSGIQCESSNGVDLSGELRLEAFEIEAFVALEASEKASLRKRRDLNRFGHSLSILSARNTCC